MDNIANSPVLPEEWRTRTLSSGVTELAIDDSRRSTAATIVGGIAFVCLGYGAWETSRGADAGAALLAVGSLLITLAVWMLFARESWRISANLLEHRVGIGPFGRVSSIRDARLVIVSYASRLSHIGYRLNAATPMGTRQLIVRNRYDEVEALGRFIAARALWRFEE